MPSPACGTSFITDVRKVGLNMSDSSISLENTPSFSHVPDVSVATFQYASGQEKELKELKKTSNESNWQYNQDTQSPSSFQGTIPKPRGNSPGFSSPDLPVDNMYQVNWRTRKIPTPS